MTNADRRKVLRERYEQSGPEAGVYRIVNRRTGRVLIGSSMNLASVASKLSFARAVGGTGGLDHRLHKDIAEFGIEAFELEVLDVVKRTPEMTPDELRRELAALEALWREEATGAALY
jgi:hypothetical protein